MLIQVLQSELRAGSKEREVEIASLAGVSFIQKYTNRASPQSIVLLLDAGEEARVLTWVNAKPGERSVTYGEVDTADWVTLPGRPIIRSVRPPRPVVSPPESPSFPVVSLEERKTGKVRSVDDKTCTLIASGFTVDGKVFSASDTAQLKWLGMYTSRADLSYPVTVPTKDDSQFVSLIEAADIATYYAALLARVQTVLSGGVTLKALIATAPDQATLDAIVDDRT